MTTVGRAADITGEGLTTDYTDATDARKLLSVFTVKSLVKIVFVLVALSVWSAPALRAIWRIGTSSKRSCG